MIVEMTKYMLAYINLLYKLWAIFSIDVLLRRLKTRLCMKFDTRENLKWVLGEFLDAFHMLTFHPKRERNLMEIVRNIFLLNIVKNLKVIGYWISKPINW